MKWKVSLPQLRRLAQLLSQSVERGATEDIPLRDHCLNVLREQTERRAGQHARKLQTKERAGFMARMTYQKSLRAG